MKRSARDRKPLATYGWWQKSRDVNLTDVKMKRSAAWLWGSALSAFMAAGGLFAVAQVHRTDALILLLSIIFCTDLWISGVTLFISFLVTTASKIFPYKE
jgi:hypothetical protein